jgi:hypothetical protein
LSGDQSMLTCQRLADIDTELVQGHKRIDDLFDVLSHSINFQRAFSSVVTLWAARCCKFRHTPLSAAASGVPALLS